jgi:hypothetical protein
MRDTRGALPRLEDYNIILDYYTVDKTHKHHTNEIGLIEYEVD